MQSVCAFPLLSCVPPVFRHSRWSPIRIEHASRSEANSRGDDDRSLATALRDPREADQEQTIYGEAREGVRSWPA